MGSSRSRRPVAWAKALARAAEVGGSEPSPAPSDGSLRCIRTISILGTSEKVRMGYADQSRLEIWRRSKATCSFSARLTAWTMPRSEEHTSELQSPCNLVCRLLLEKKKKIKINIIHNKKKKNTNKK